MFDGVPDQFHHFITPRTSLPLHLSFPLHASAAAAPSNSFPPFDPYNPPPHQLPLQLQPNLLHPLHHHHHPSSTPNDEAEKEENTTVPMNFEIERDQRQLPELIDPWTNDEVLALLRIRSSMESWFPELTWEHVSRKLAGLGYKRSADKCKEKFEEESRYFNNINNYAKNNYRFLSELEEVYQGGDHHQVETEKTTQQLEKAIGIEGQDKEKMMGHALEEGSRNLDESATKEKEQGGDEVIVVEKTKDRPKRKRPDRFEVFKGFCESIVHKMMEQQEEMHNKLIQDMMKRDEEKFAREEAWKKQEMDRMNKELEMMAQEQAIAGDRQANVIEFLKKFSSTSPSSQSFIASDKLKVKTTNSSPLHSQNPNPSTDENSPQPTQPSSTVLLNHINTATSSENPSSSPAQATLQVVASSTSAAASQNPSASLNRQNINIQLETNSVSNKASSNLVCTEKDDIGRRWPKDEVLALINLRCTSVNNNNNEDKEGNKAPLWERISQGMLELGYKRSAKRCKEKWENINKYFRKTKDVNKKRSLDSRTCPYFHLLSNLYNQGKLLLQSEKPENHLSPPANIPGQVPSDHQTQLAESSQVGSGGFSMHVDHGGEKSLMQVPSLDFDQF